MRIDTGIVGAVVGLVLAVPVSIAFEVRPGHAPQPGPARVTAAAPVRSAPASLPNITSRSAPGASSSSPAAMVEALSFGSGRVDYGEELPALKVPTFAGLPMGKRLKPCAYDERVFSDDCTPRY